MDERTVRIVMRYALCSFLILWTLIPNGSPAQRVGDGSGGVAPTTAVVDWTRSEGRINRAIFSTQGFMQVYVEPDPLVMDTFVLINPSGTQTRLETYIHQMEPENDNDDPNTFNWSAFHPEQQIRFIDNRSRFIDTVKNLGMEPLALLCYNVDWLKSGNPDDILADHDEWAEFAAAVVESYNGARGKDYRLNLRLVEVWNEPNFADFKIGTRAAYNDLFIRTARRIHRDYPGVIVGGPCVTIADSNAGEWMEGFIRDCGPDADYIIYHTYGESPGQIVTDVKRWVEQFRRIPGRADGKMMITETDQWIHGWPKIQYVLERQFRFLDISDLLLGIHHFCCVAYRERGNYTFGIVDKQGAVLGGTFWPYWLFRNLIGTEAFTHREGTRRTDFDLAASWYKNASGQWLSTAVFHNRTEKPLEIDTFLYFPPSRSDRVLAFNRVTQDFQGVDRVERVPAGTDRMRLALSLSSGEGLALTLQEPGKRFYSFSDLNNQETPWIGLTADREVLELGQECTLRARIVNPTFSPVNGKLVVRGLPAGWQAEVTGGNTKVEALGFGETQECAFRFTSASVLTQERVAPCVVLEAGEGTGDTRAADSTHSIPVSIQLRNPLSALALPIPVQTVQGEANQVTLQITNQVNQAVEGTLSISAPEGIRAVDPPKQFRVAAKHRERLQFPLAVAADTSIGDKKGTIVLEFLGSRMEVPFTVSVSAGPPSDNAAPLDLKPHANFDAVAFDANRKDFDARHMGLFSYPGDFTPSGRVVRVRGVPFAMLPLEEGRKNCILPQGQRLAVPSGRYAGVMFMGFGHDGKHPGTWTFHYEDGSSQAVNSQIPEWCSPLPDGPENFQEAFTAPYRYIPDGPAPPACQLFTWTLKTDSSKALKAIELPKMEHAYLFAITLLKAQ